MAPAMANLKIIYDGDCPFCSSYVRFTRLRNSVASVELIDARSDHLLVRELKAAGFDLNEGMLAEYEGQRYFGPDCMHLLAMLSSRSGLMNRAMAFVMSRKLLARGLYPFLRLGRNATLRVLGRAPIS